MGLVRENIDTQKHTHTKKDVDIYLSQWTCRQSAGGFSSGS